MIETESKDVRKDGVNIEGSEKSGCRKRATDWQSVPVTPTPSASTWRSEG